MENSTLQGWYLTALSSLLCVLGCGSIYVDDIYYLLLPRAVTSRYPFEIKENYHFMTGSLAFSAGCLLFTSLYRLLPEASSFLGSAEGEHSDKWAQAQLMVAYISGILVCVVLNWLLHLLTSESVVHCAHGGHEHGGHGNNNSHSHDEIHDQASSHSHTHSPVNFKENQTHTHSPSSSEDTHEQIPQVVSERIPLLQTKKSFLHYIVNADNTSECKGYSSAERCMHASCDSLHFCELPEMDITDHSSRHEIHEEDDSQPPDHHHHVNSPLSRLLLIGVQTTLAITIHKLPEGFITFVTSETNPKLGFQIFFSLLVHNITEGFSMCLPLYYSFAKSSAPMYAKFKAFGISAFLGGLSQPLGALGGMMLMTHNKKVDLDSLDYIYGITMAITSGFLTVIGFSMYGSAVSFGGSQNWVLFWCVAGIAVIGGTTVVAVN